MKAKPFLSMLVTMLLIGIFSLSACSVTREGSGTEAEQPASAEEAADSVIPEEEEVGDAAVTEEESVIASDEEITLNVLVGHWTVGSDDSPFDAAKAELESRYPNVTVTFDVQQGGDNVKSKFLSSSAAGESPDVSMVDSLAIGELVEAGLLSDLTSYVEAWDQWEDILPQFREAGSWEDTPYGVFMNTDMRMFVWNKQIFADSGLDPETPPTSWDELLEVAETVNNPPSVYAMVFPGSSAEQLSMRWYIFLRGAGGEILDDNGCVAFNSDAGVQAATLYKQFIDDGYTPVDVLSAAPDDSDKALAAGSYAMGVVGSWFFNFAKEAGIETPEAFNETFGVSFVPSPDGTMSPSSAGGWTVAVPAEASNPDLAWEFISIAMNTENQREWALGRGYVPVRESLSGDAAFVEVIPFYPTLQEQLPEARTRPAIPEYSQISTELQDALQSIMLGDTEPQEALDTAAANANALLEGCGS